ncbi:MAG: class I SAM-dependent methyltransferase [bacterium]|jgi:predicted O-methyltransferase YrrM
MFNDIPGPVHKRMKYLEELDARHRKQEMDGFKRLRQIPPQTGRFIALLCAAAPEGACLEIGTSGGYSGMWLSLACRATGKRLTTFEVADAKIEIATETFKAAGLDDIVKIVPGDAREHIGDHADIGFCFLDAEKDAYDECYELVVPNLVKGGILVADNVISHEKILRPWVEKILADERVDALVVPIGSGELVVRKT